MYAARRTVSRDRLSKMSDDLLSESTAIEKQQSVHLVLDEGRMEGEESKTRIHQPKFSAPLPKEGEDTFYHYECAIMRVRKREKKTN